MMSNSVSSAPRGANAIPPITFTQEDAIGVYYPHCDAFVVKVNVVRNDLNRMLLDNRSSINILFGATYKKMQIGLELTPTTVPLHGFTKDSIILKGRVILSVKMGTTSSRPFSLWNFP